MWLLPFESLQDFLPPRVALLGYREAELYGLRILLLRYFSDIFYIWVSGRETNSEDVKIE